jgi:hypothetical protein
MPLRALHPPLPVLLLPTRRKAPLIICGLPPFQGHLAFALTLHFSLRCDAKLNVSLLLLGLYLTPVQLPTC